MSDQIVELRAALDRRKRSDWRSLLLVAVLTISLGGSLAWNRLTQHDPWAPIGALPVQSVHNPRVGIDEFVHVTATKCFNELPVTVSGIQSWQSISNTSVLVEVGRGQRVFDPRHPLKGDHWVGRCVTTEFANPVDPKVVDWARKGLTEWRIVGVMTPERLKGSNGVQRTWISEPISVSATVLNPLGPYPVQHVVTVRGDIAIVEGTLCARKTVPVMTTISWEAFRAPYAYPADAIPGSFITFAANIAQVRQKGCTRFAGTAAFVNPVPTTVRALDQSIQVVHEWRIVGTEQAEGSDPVPFFSDPIRLH